MDDLDINRMMGLLDKYCSDRECVIMCKMRDRSLKYDCVIARFIRYMIRQDDVMKNHNID